MTDDDEDVGYGKPPRRTQFPKGTSGNPRGRPKGARGLASLTREILSSKIEVTHNGRPKSVSALEAILQRTKVDALKGNKAAQDRMLLLAARYGPDESSAPESPNQKELQQNVVAQLRRLTKMELEIYIMIREKIAEEYVEFEERREKFIRDFGKAAAFWLHDPDRYDVNNGGIARC